jgi:hypothetical protein
MIQENEASKIEHNRTEKGDEDMWLVHRLRRASRKGSRLSTQNMRTQRLHKRKDVGGNCSVLTKECVHTHIKHLYLQRLAVESPYRRRRIITTTFITYLLISK